VENGILIRPPITDLLDGEKNTAISETGEVAEEFPSKKSAWLSLSKKGFLEAISKFRKEMTDGK